jgi:hypothetical protein
LRLDIRAHRILAKRVIVIIVVVDKAQVLRVIAADSLPTLILRNHTTGMRHII